MGGGQCRDKNILWGSSENIVELSRNTDERKGGSISRGLAVVKLNLDESHQITHSESDAAGNFTLTLTPSDG